MLIVSLYRAFGYYLTFLFFGLFGLVLNVVCLLLSWLPQTRGAELCFQRVIHWHFALFVWWMGFARLCHIDYRALAGLSAQGGLVVVANHPGLMDATYLLARMPAALCIFKPAIRRNPVLGAAARRAGYLASDGGIDLVRAAADKVAAGHRLIVFPEGTRSTAGELLPFKPGFALIAQRAQSPVQLVRITCNSNALSKGHTWWKVPRLPIGVVVEVGPRLDPAGDQDAAGLVARAEAWFKGARPASA